VIKRTVLILAIGILVLPAPLGADDKPSDAQALQGTWQMVSQQRDGRTTGRPRNMKWVFEGNTIWLVVERGQEELSQEKAPAPKGEDPPGKSRKQPASARGLRITFRLDPARSPKQIDLDGPRKALHYGIYKLDGDELTVCMGISQLSPTYGGKGQGDESTRPAALRPEAGTLILLKRVKK
jgi:uncharacterized protein (TIGR03067 family)